VIEVKVKEAGKGKRSRLFPDEPIRCVSSDATATPKLALPVWITASRSESAPNGPAGTLRAFEDIDSAAH
jgi:hypothetical protein